MNTQMVHPKYTAASADKAGQLCVRTRIASTKIDVQMQLHKKRKLPTRFALMLPLGEEWPESPSAITIPPESAETMPAAFDAEHASIRSSTAIKRTKMGCEGCQAAPTTGLASFRPVTNVI
eukprot:CAMPEP_0172769428 /NCGR_PEP_ID=MMETSP1074-20121228/186643_1 /TAXON_ID=2916 /ORGANISM="Ceratium fusus, Strain PA161109" /LENGTH=120 /DNA_ID=CAMNT_0013605003 /DNA_START=325 /DNA_END=687 /DNA_ORIENTATION=-